MIVEVGIVYSKQRRNKLGTDKNILIFTYSVFSVRHYEEREKNYLVKLLVYEKLMKSYRR